MNLTQSETSDSSLSPSTFPSAAVDNGHLLAPRDSASPALRAPRLLSCRHHGDVVLGQSCTGQRKAGQSLCPEAGRKSGTVQVRTETTWKKVTSLGSLPRMRQSSASAVLCPTVSSFRGLPVSMPVCLHCRASVGLRSSARNRGRIPGFRNSSQSCYGP